MAYKSCWWLQDHLEFSLRNKVRACCYGYMDSGNVNRGSVVLAEIKEDKFPATEIIASKARIHSEIAQSLQDDCRECPVLTLKDWNTPRYLAKFVTMNPWSHCNLACQYCYTVAPGFKQEKVSYSIPAVIRDMLDGGYLDPNGKVVWGGGDISALPEFNEVSLMYTDYGVHQEFKTSGLKYLGGVARALSENKGAVEISVDAGTRETYASYKGKDVWDRVVSNILRYREHGPINLKYIADFPNLEDEDIYGFVDLVHKVRPASVIVTPEYSSAWVNRFDPETIGKMAKLLHLVKRTGFLVEPSDDAMGERLFFKTWPELKNNMARLAA